MLCGSFRASTLIPFAFPLVHLKERRMRVLLSLPVLSLSSFFVFIAVVQLGFLRYVYIISHCNFKASLVRVAVIIFIVFLQFWCGLYFC
jgi:hypothetical protein